MARRTATCTGGGTREQEVRDIRIGDQQHDADDGEQDCATET